MCVTALTFLRPRNASFHITFGSAFSCIINRMAVIFRVKWRRPRRRDRTARKPCEYANEVLTFSKVGNLRLPQCRRWCQHDSWWAAPYIYLYMYMYTHTDTHTLTHTHDNYCNSAPLKLLISNEEVSCLDEHWQEEDDESCGMTKDSSEAWPPYFFTIDRFPAQMWCLMHCLSVKRA